jgi:hypothetical protein
VNAYGEYGAGRKVTSWQKAQRRYQRDSDDEEKPSAAPAKKADVKTKVSPAINWGQLGLGFGGNDTAPKFDDAGRAISGLASNTSGRDGGLPLAALQAIAVAAGVGQAAAGRTPTTRAEVSRSKVAKTLEVKAEARALEPPSAENQAPQDIQQYNGGYGDGRGRGGYGGRGRGGGRSNNAGLGNYGPQGGKSIEQRKAESTCNHCRMPGHWFLECQARLNGLPAVPHPPRQQQQHAPQQQQTTQPQQQQGPRVTATPNASGQDGTTAAGNGPGQ